MIGTALGQVRGPLSKNGGPQDDIDCCRRHIRYRSRILATRVVRRIKAG
jgi:hypothetical protein